MNAGDIGFRLAIAVALGLFGSGGYARQCRRAADQSPLKK